MEGSVLELVFMIATIIFNLFATHLRTSKWFPYKLRWQITIGIAAIGLIGFLLAIRFDYSIKGEFLILISPLIFNVIDRFFMFISYKYQNRDFQFNTSFEYWFNQHRKGISFMDHIITLASLLILVGLMILPLIFMDTLNQALK